MELGVVIVDMVHGLHCVSKINTCCIIQSDLTKNYNKLTVKKFNFAISAFLAVDAKMNLG